MTTKNFSLIKPLNKKMGAFLILKVIFFQIKFMPFMQMNQILEDTSMSYFSFSFAHFFFIQNIKYL